MALIECPDCGRQVSTRAANCPGCGAPMEGPAVAPPRSSAPEPEPSLQPPEPIARHGRPDKRDLMIFLGLAGLLIVALLAASHGRWKQALTELLPPREATSEGQARAVAARAKKAVLASLKDPESAIFGPMEVRATGNDSALVSCGSVNARNGFGGYTGMRRVIVGAGQAEVKLEPSDDSGPFEVLWLLLCSSNLVGTVEHP